MRSILLLMLMVGGLCHAQSPTVFRFPKAGVVRVSEVVGDYHPSLEFVEAPVPDGNSEKGRVARMKEELAERYAHKGDGSAAEKVLGGAANPWLGDNFRSNNTIDGVPNDNDMAISNGGKIVSVINSNIWMHDEDGTVLANVSLDAWASSLGLGADKYDPRALYDPLHDRFIVVCLSGFTDSTSNIIVGFSQTNDPTGGWNLYALPGDPRDDSLWTDYPIMALSPQELFLTANLLYNDQPWQTGFARSLCWQIDLDSAYAGAPLLTQLWDSVYFGGRPVRNLCPIQGGSAPSGHGMYFLSNRNLAVANDTIWIMRITDSIGVAGAQFNVGFQVSDVEYGLPPNAVQQFNLSMATNDARCLDGFIENDVIQFVGNTVDTSTGRAALYHGIIRDVSTVPTIEGKVIGNADGAYGYPGITWLGMTAGSNEALIGLNYLGANAQNHPGCGAIYYDGNGNYSDRVVARAGTGYINALSGLDRWGDYMGVQLRYNQPGVAWISGTWGQPSHLPATWIAEFHHPAIVSNEDPEQERPEAVAFPNPVDDRFSLAFELGEATFLEIALYDVQGRKQKVLLKDVVKRGKSRFAFSTEPLAAGVYFIRLEGPEGVIASEKIVKLD